MPEADEFTADAEVEAVCDVDAGAAKRELDSALAAALAPTVESVAPESLQEQTGGSAPSETDTPAEIATDEPPAAQEAADAAASPTPGSADAALAEAVSGGVTWIPFACYLGLWVVFVGLSAYFLYGADASEPARWTPVYTPLLWTGVGLTALGPVLSSAVWLVARSKRPKAERRGLFASAMTRGALVAFFGVAIWMATLFLLEVVASGVTL